MNKIIQYQKHHELKNNNSLTEVNCQLRKIESPQNQSMHKQPKRNSMKRTKGKSRKFKDNYEQRKDYLTIIKKYRMENS